MRSFLILALLPLLLPAAPAATPRFSPNLEQDALTIQKMANEKRLIKLGERVPAKWMTNAQIEQLYKDHTNFMDITFTQDLEKGRAPSALEGESTTAIPTEPTQMEVVKPIIAQANTDLMKSALKTLTDFNNRYYRSSTGAASGEWIFNKVKEIVAASSTKLNVTVTQFKHDWGQHSVIARIEGQNGNQETVIMGAHQDSINGGSPMSGRAPGADDDGSGSVSVMEALRVILASDYAPLRPIEFMWYAAEEAGLLGSQAIAQAYKKQGRVVYGALQLDMDMFPNKATPHVAILTDNVDTDLTKLLRNSAPIYTGLPTKDFRCGYGCSDHASWTRAGYRAAFSGESSNMRENPNIHTSRDTYESVNFDFGLLLTKLAVGFLVELSHP